MVYNDNEKEYKIMMKGNQRCNKVAAISKKNLEMEMKKEYLR